MTALSCAAWVVFGIGILLFVGWVLDCLGIIAFWREEYFDDDGDLM